MSVFVDTGAWFAYFVRRAPDHNPARQWIANNESSLLSTDYVLDELFTLLKIRESHSLAVAAGKAFMEENICQIVSVTPDDFVRAWNIFAQFRDKGWSFTDCTSKVIIERLDISIAFSFDQHFEQFGSVMRVP